MYIHIHTYTYTVYIIGVANYVCKQLYVAIHYQGFDDSTLNNPASYVHTYCPVIGMLCFI